MLLSQLGEYVLFLYLYMYPVLVKGQMDIPCRIGTHRLVQNFLIADLPDLIAIVDTYRATWDWKDGGCKVYGIDVDHSQAPNVCMYYAREYVVVAPMTGPHTNTPTCSKLPFV